MAQTLEELVRQIVREEITTVVDAVVQALKPYAKPEPPNLLASHWQAECERLNRILYEANPHSHSHSDCRAARDICTQHHRHSMDDPMPHSPCCDCYVCLGPHGRVS